VWLSAHSIQYKKLEAGQVFYLQIIMIQSNERSLKPYTAAQGLLWWPCPIKVTAFFSKFKNQPQHSSQTNSSGRWLAEIGLIPIDDLPRMANFRLMTYWEWPNPGRWLIEIGQIPAYDKPESQKRIWWNQQPKAIFRGRGIPACRKQEFIGVFNLIFRELKNAVKLITIKRYIYAN
jgi:hypothetical protein